ILPKKDGFEVLAEIKDQNKDGVVDIPVILLTNISGMENVQKALDLGATTYLVKADYQLEEVVEKVNKTLGK
nr:response regulator [Patescibacteria group bacterium]